MKNLLPIIAVAALFLLMGKKSKKTYKVVEVDGPSTYVILKDGDSYWQFAVPNAFIGRQLVTPADAQVASAHDYAVLTGTEYVS